MVYRRHSPHRAWCDYAPVRGCMVIKPYGYAMWELIQKDFDAALQGAPVIRTSTCPMLIPESLLLKEAEHVEGFAPEVAWVTQGGTEKLERAPVPSARPPRRMFCTMYAKMGAVLARSAHEAL